MPSLYDSWQRNAEYKPDTRATDRRVAERQTQRDRPPIAAVGTGTPTPTTLPGQRQQQQQANQAQQTQQSSTGSTTNAQAAAGAQAQAGNTTAGTTPPPTSTGSGLPAYAASYNFWQNNSAPPPAPAGSVYNAPINLQSMGVDPNTPGYDPRQNNAPTWVQPGGNADAATAALNSVLSGDASGMDTSAMKNKYKEQRLQMLGDEQRAGQQAAAGRGMLDSGYQSGQERRQRGEANKEILGAFRDTDIAAADAAVRNKIAASTALDTVLTGEVGRAETGYENEYKTNEFEDTQQKNAFEYGQERFNNQVAAGNILEGRRKDEADSILAKYKAETATTMEGRAQDIQVATAKSNELLGRLGLAVQLEDIAKGDTRSKMEFLVDLFDILVRNEQANAQLGLSYSQLGMNKDQIMATMISGLGL